MKKILILAARHKFLLVILGKFKDLCEKKRLEEMMEKSALKLQKNFSIKMLKYGKEIKVRQKNMIRQAVSLHTT